MVDKIVKHKPADETVGEEVDSVEWASGEIHELPEDSILLISKPPSGYYKIYNLYAEKTGAVYHLKMVVEDTPKP